MLLFFSNSLYLNTVQFALPRFFVQVLGDKLYLLDRDNDGELSAEELKQAVVRTLKRETSVQDAEELIKILDRNKDGKGILHFFNFCNSFLRLWL